MAGRNYKHIYKRSRTSLLPKKSSNSGHSLLYNVKINCVQNTTSLKFFNRRGGGKPNIQTRLDNFFVQPSTPGPTDYRILVEDSLGKPNHKVVNHIKKWINKKDPEASINTDFNKKVQQKEPQLWTTHNLQHRKPHPQQESQGHRCTHTIQNQYPINKTKMSQPSLHHNQRIQ